jgi:peptide/nickel transport system substrate-binding protein
VRFDNYWGEGPWLDEFENFGIGDPVARVNAFLANDIDGISSVPSPAIERIEGTPGKVIWSTESGSYVSIASRQDMMPSGNRDLVLAMKYLMDRERLVRGVLRGHGSHGNDQPINRSYADYCPDIPQRVLDPERAKYHFEKSGIGSTEIPIVAAEIMPGTLEQVLNLQREAHKIGLNIAVQRVATDGYWSSVWLNEPICVVSWNMRPTANIMLTLAYQSEARWNDSFWKNEHFDDLLIKSRSATDPVQRRQMYCDMQNLIHEEAGTIIPVHRNFVDAVASYVRGQRAVPLGPFGGGEAVEYLWRADEA